MDVTGCSSSVKVSSFSPTVYVWFSLLGDVTGVWPRLGELAGVLARMAVVGELGDDGRRNGDARGELNDKGDGLYGKFEFMLKVFVGNCWVLCC